jgi:hypothetical protein
VIGLRLRIAFGIISRNPPHPLGLLRRPRDRPRCRAAENVMNSRRFS